MVRFSGIGSEQSGLRPAIIVQNNVGNKYSPNVIVVPLTSKHKKNMDTHVFLSSSSTGLRMDSIALCENVTCVSKDRIENFVTTLDDSYMTKIAKAMLIATAIMKYINSDNTIHSIIEKSTSLNQCA